MEINISIRMPPDSINISANIGHFVCMIGWNAPFNGAFSPNNRLIPKISGEYSLVSKIMPVILGLRPSINNLLC